MLIRVYFIIGWYFELFDHMLMTCLLYMHVGYWFFFFFFFVRISGLFDSLVFFSFFSRVPVSFSSIYSGYILCFIRDI